MTRKPMKKVGGLLEDLAVSLLQEALNGDHPVQFDQKLDAFKALTTYHVGVTRVNAKAPQNEDDPIGFNFGAARKKISDASSS